MRKTLGLFCRRRSGTVVFLTTALALALTIGGLDGIRAPTAHAQPGHGHGHAYGRGHNDSDGPTIVQSATADYMSGGIVTTQDGWYVADASVSLPGTVTAGDELVLLAGWGGGNPWQPTGICDNGSCQAGMWTSSSDNSMFVPADAGAQPVDGLNDRAAIGLAPVTSTTSGITAGIHLAEDISWCSPSSAPCANGVQVTLTLVEVTGVDPRAADGGPNYYALNSGWATLAENGAGGTVHTTNASRGLGTSYSDLDLAIYVDGGADKTISAPSGETEIGSNDSPTVNIGHDQASATAQSSMTFDTSGNAGNAVIAAVSIAGPGPSWHTIGSWSGDSAQTLTTVDPILGAFRFSMTCVPTINPPEWDFGYSDGEGGGVGPCDANHTSFSDIIPAPNLSSTTWSVVQYGFMGNWTVTLEMYY